MAHQRLERLRRHRRARGAVKPQDLSGFWPRCGQRPVEAGIVEDVGRATPHLRQPERGNGRSYRVVVDEHAAGVLGANVVIQTHHECAFRGVARSSKMPRFVLITIAHVKDIGGLRRVVAPLREGGAIYRPNAGAPGEVAGALTSTLTGLRTRSSGVPCGPTFEYQTLKEPATGAVPEHIHFIRHTGGDQARATEDPSSARHTIHHHLRRRLAHQIVEAAQHLAGRRVDAAGNVASLVLLARAAVDEYPVLPACDGAFELAGLDESRSSVVRHEIAETLGRHLDLGEQGQSRCGPGRSTAGEHCHVHVPEPCQAVCRHGGEPFTSVRDNDARVAARDQPAYLALDVPESQMGREQGVTGAKRHDLTHVKEGNLPAILEHRRDLGGRSGDLWHICPLPHTPERTL